MQSPREFEVDFRIEFAHYVEATLRAHGEAYMRRCVDSVDGLGLLAKDIVGLLGRTVADTAASWEMYGQTLWVLNRRSDQISVNLLEFLETQQSLPNDHYATVYRFSRCAFFVSVDFIDFVAAVERAFADLEKNGFDKNYYHWAQVYPYKEVEELRRFLRGVRH